MNPISGNNVPFDEIKEQEIHDKHVEEDTPQAGNSIIKLPEPVPFTPLSHDQQMKAWNNVIPALKFDEKPAGKSAGGMHRLGKHFTPLDPDVALELYSGKPGASRDQGVSRGRARDRGRGRCNIL